jgi:hypothetical protein
MNPDAITLWFASSPLRENYKEIIQKKTGDPPRIRRRIFFCFLLLLVVVCLMSDFKNYNLSYIHTRIDIWCAHEALSCVRRGKLNYNVTNFKPLREVWHCAHLSCLSTGSCVSGHQDFFFFFWVCNTRRRSWATAGPHPSISLRPPADTHLMELNDTSADGSMTSK